jgi:fructosamine-3-kinase
MSSNKNDIVLDVLGGGGSTYHAAQMHGRLWVGCDIVDVPALSRFATLWGRNESDRIKQKIYRVFEKDFIDHYLSEKRRNKVHPIDFVPLLSNGDSLMRKDVVSKSKTLT